MRAAIVLILISVVAGCNPPDVVEATVDAPPIRLSYDTTGPTPCAGTAPFLADTARRQAAFLGLMVPSQIDYHYWSDRSLPNNCSTDGPACAAIVNGTPTIWSHYAAMPHELVHAIVFPVQPVRFFAEALAVALGGDDGNADSLPYSFTPDQLLDNDGAGVPTIAFYGIAGDFGSYMIDRWGATDFALLNPVVMRGTSTADVEKAFANAYGETMAAAFDDRRNSTRRYASDRLGFPECGTAATPWTQAGWSLSETIDCATNGISSSDDPDGMTSYATVEVPVAGIYSVSLKGDNSSKRFSFQRCTSGEQINYFPSAQPDLTHVTISGTSPLVFAWMPQARHFLRYVAEPQTPASFSVSIQPTTDAADHCVSAGSVIDDSSDGVFAVTPWDGPTIVVAFTVSADRAAIAVLRQATLALCDGTCDVSGVACRSLTSGETLPLSTGHNYALVSKGSGLHSFAGLELIRR